MRSQEEWGNPQNRQHTCTEGEANRKKATQRPAPGTCTLVVRVRSNMFANNKELAWDAKHHPSSAHHSVHMLQVYSYRPVVGLWDIVQRWCMPHTDTRHQFESHHKIATAVITLQILR